MINLLEKVGKKRTTKTKLNLRDDFLCQCLPDETL
jgi:hypothetical protein